MKLKEVLIRAVRITLLPSEEWKNLSQQTLPVKEILWGFGLPVILFSSLGRDIGLFFIVKPVMGFSFNLVKLLFFNLVSWVVIPYILILSAAYILNFILPRIHFQTNFESILKLIVFTFTPLFIATFFIYLHPLLRFLIPAGIIFFIAYTILIFWYGLQYLYSVTWVKKVELSVTVILAFAAIFFSQELYSWLVGYLFPGMEAYVK